MLIAKITPSARIVRQINAFEFVVSNVEYLTVVVNQYIPNSQNTHFTINFGIIPEPTPPNEPQQPNFIVTYMQELVLTSEQLSSWGTDDTTLLQIICNVLGVQILEFKNI